MVAGLETITGGELRIGDRVVNNVEPKDRDIAMVFQSYALYPHMSVADNIGFSLKLHKVPKDEIARRVREAARMLALEEYLDRKPKQLSGGQRQRVAMGRAIVREPQVFLMDEPLSNLDAKLRVQMRGEIARIQQRLGVTTIYVTHDQVEAMTMGHRVAVMKRGVLQQVDTPQFIYDNPANLFVAGFIGSPPMNLLEVGLSSSADGPVIHVGDQRLALDPSVMDRHPGLGEAIRSQATVVMGVRPEDLEDASLVPGSENRVFKAKVDITEALGSEVVVHFGVDAKQVFSDDNKKGGEELGTIASEHGATVIASFNARTHVRPGALIDVAVDTSRLHFFEVGTGDRL
jgi:multiple sugar transport system ATP-binding protein